VSAFDVIVIGGGIAGISAAARLAGDTRVLLLEREASTGYHSTGRSAAVFFDDYGNEAVRAVTATSRPFYDAPDPQFWPLPLLSPRGVLQLAAPGQEVLLDAELAASPHARRVSLAEAMRMVPVLRPGAIAAAMLSPDAANIDVDLLLQGFLRMLRAGAGVVKTGAEVTRLSRADGHWQVETPHEAFKAAIVVNAAGAWADEIAARAGVAQIGLTPMRRSAAIIPAPADMDVSGWPLFGSINEDWYAGPMGGKLMISPADEDPAAPQDAWPDDLVLAGGIDRFERMTTCTVARVERSWAGLRSFVADRTPVAGFDPSAEGFFWLAAQGGYGIQTAPGLSELARDLILDQTPLLDAAIVQALSPSRPGLRP
jgi:D-arginine dehydrogenase